MVTLRAMDFLTTSDGQFHVLRWGSGSRVMLLVHGFNQTAHSWEEVGPRLAELGATVVAFTQRGHGDSLRSPGNYSREVMTQDIGAVADVLELSSFTLVGMSMGAVHALGFAAEQPSRVERLVVVDYAPQVRSEGVDKIKLMLGRSWSSFDDAVAEVRLFNPRRSEENIRARLRHTIAERDGRWRWKVDLAFADEGRFQQASEDMWAVVERTPGPTLLVRGANSDLLDAETAQEMAQRLPGGELCVIPEAGHSVAGDNPDAFVAEVSAFSSRP